MTVRNLESLFRPLAITVVGASRRTGSIGAVVARNLIHAGFDGPVMPVSPLDRAIEGVLTYHSVEDLPVCPDLAVICAPADAVPATIDRLGRRGTRAAVVITGGFAPETTQRMLDAARPYLLRLLGPNSLGVMVPGRGVNASCGHVAPIKGDVALVAQSSMVVTSIIDWATSRGIGFSHLVSLGDMIDVDFGDLLDHLAIDSGVRAILLYIERISNARKFMSAARSAARQKPVIVIKAGRSEEAQAAASSHTGALAIADAVYDAAFRRAGLLRVDSLDELFDAVGTLSSGVAITGDRLAIVTNGGGMGVMATDGLIRRGGRLAQLAPETQEALEEIVGNASGNPVRLGADAPPERFAAALTEVLRDPGCDAALVVHCPNAVTDRLAAAAAVAETAKAQPDRIPRRAVLTSWLGDGTAVQARRLFAGNRIPTYETPIQAVRGFMHLVEYRRNQDLLMVTPPSIADAFTPNTSVVREVIDEASSAGRQWLTEDEAKRLLDAYGIPTIETRCAATPDLAAEAAAELGGILALKIISPDIVHKSDVGGVALDLYGSEAVRTAALAMIDRVRGVAPTARIDGFAVQRMAVRPEAYELIVGMTENPLFGPVLLFGEGGIGVEVVEDCALSLPPLNVKLAREMMERTRIWRRLRGYRSRPAVDIDAVALTLNKISQLVVDFPEVAELDINPLLADCDGVVALDASIRIVSRRSECRLAIRPYPKELEDTVSIRDGRTYRIRPVLPEDEPLVHTMFERMTAEDIRLRFFAPMKKLSHQAAARLTQIDYDREMGLVAVAPNPETGLTEMYGIVRIAADPDNLHAEYAVMVRSDMKGKGLGFMLMNRILDYARKAGIKEIFGEVLRENTSMLAMCRTLGFVRKETPNDPGVIEVRIELGADLETA